MNKIAYTALALACSCALLAGCAGSGQNAASNEQASDEPAAASSASDGAAQDSGSASDAADRHPITGDMVADGTYEISVDSSSSMFNIEKCELTVADGKMTALLTLHGHGYEKLFMGTSADAANASDDQFAYYTDDDGDGHYSYTVPVAALDEDVPCAAFSIKRQQWYDRTLVFESDGIPADKISR